MIERINEPVTDWHALHRGYIFRDGFVFTVGSRPAIYDTLVIRTPENAVHTYANFAFSEKTLDEHIELINKHKLHYATIICDDLSFILRCPSLHSINVYPVQCDGNKFDYSPLYQMTNLQRLCCQTTHGANNQYHYLIDYSKVRGVTDIAAAGEGHIGYELVPSLEVLWISDNKRLRDFSNISCSVKLKDVTLIQCGIQSLSGIEKHCSIKSLALFHNRSLSDISALASLSGTLQILAIEACPKITDFSVLNKLTNLEHLQLYGSNTLPDLSFLDEMKQLKTFTFTMNVKNGDLTPCLRLPYASCKNRKHFNIKDRDLPKSN